METSPEIDKLSEALAKAQGQLKPAAFDRENPHFKNRYATLTSITEAARPALSANGIALVQTPVVETEPVMRVGVTSMLMLGNQFIRGTLFLKPVNDTPQAVGSALTYARRYSLAALVGIVAEEDDDGEMATTDKPANRTFRKVIEGKGEKKQQAEVTKTETTKNEANKPEEKPPTTVVTVKSDRVGKMREIFSLSAKLNQSPSVMKGFIGEILGLDWPIKSSEEIPDDKIDFVLNRFKEEVSKLGQEAKAA